MYSEKGNLSEVLCKPKILPIKSAALERLEALEKEASKPPVVSTMSVPAAASYAHMADDF